MPMTVWPSGAMNSSGAYWASDATVSVPFDLIAAGTSLAIDVSTVGVAGAEADVELLLLLVELLLPQPASATMTSTGAAIARTVFLIWTPASLVVRARRARKYKLVSTGQ